MIQRNESERWESVGDVYVGGLVGLMCLVCRMTMLVDGLSSVVDIKNGFPQQTN